MNSKIDNLAKVLKKNTVLEETIIQILTRKKDLIISKLYLKI